MATFFVGQRVRVKWTDEPFAVQLIGSEARIIGEMMLLDVEAWELDIECPRGGGWLVEKAYASECLTPILPDGHRAGDYSLTELLDQCRAGEGIPA